MAAHGDRGHGAPSAPGDRRPAFPDDFHLYLASQSPRRRELLQGLGVPFAVVGSRGRERSCGSPTGLLAQRNARAKMEGAVLPADRAPGAFVLGADTIVVVDGLVLGKPADEADARSMLHLLSGRAHEVISGVALARESFPTGADDQGPRTVVAGWTSTRVDVRTLTDEDVEAYLASGEWTDKAGSYAIQGLAALLVSGVDGDYANVVGLPLGLLAHLFRRQGFELLRRIWVG
jgi:septum formation protein